MFNSSMIKEERKYNEEKAVFSVRGAIKTRQLHLKNEMRTFSNTIHKNKLKMD